MRKLTRRGFSGVAAGAVLATGFVGARAQQHKWRLQGYLPAAMQINKDFVAWAAELKTKSNGAIDIDLAPVGSVVPVTDTLDAISNGVLTGHYTGPPYFAAKDAAFAVIGDTMSAYESAEQRDRWFTEGGGLELTRKLYARFGVHLIGTVFSAAEWLPSKKALNGVDDFKGLKIRGPQGTVNDLFAKMGASVVTLPGTEVFNALENGVVDAADWAWLDLNDASGLYRVVKFSSFVPHSMGVTEVSVSQRAWAALSPDLQKLVTDELARYSAETKARLTAGEVAAEKRVKEKGVSLITWPQAERDKVRALAMQVWNDLAAKSAAAKEAVESHRAFMTKIGLKI